MNKLWVISVIAVCAGCTFLERAFPFLLFRGKTVPEPVSTLGKLLPMAIITTLVLLPAEYKLFRTGCLGSAGCCKRVNRGAPPLERKHHAFDSRRHGMLHGFNTACVLTSDCTELQVVFPCRLQVV